MYKCFFTVFIVLFSLDFGSAQDVKSFYKGLYEIDSLIDFSNFHEAEIKIDSLQNMIKNKYFSDFDEPKLYLELQKSIVILEKLDFKTSLSKLLIIHSKAIKFNYHKISCRADLYISLIHESNSNFAEAFKYIKLAANDCKNYNINNLYSTVNIRRSSLRRVMDSIVTIPNEYLKDGLSAGVDSTIHEIEIAIDSAQKYNRNRDINDGNLLLGIIYSNYKYDYEKSNKYFLMTIPLYLKINDPTAVAMTNINIDRNYLNLGDYKTALIYNNEALKYYNQIYDFSSKSNILQNRADIFKKLNQYESAYYYLKLAVNELDKSYGKQIEENAKKLETEYQNAKYEERLNNKNRQILYIFIIFILLLITSIYIFSKNNKISSQNKIINSQIAELKKYLGQKQILLSELQHRVKNNLQYVISILEIQKESIDHSNIDDLIRSNQNRIHTIALLHKKLNVLDSVTEVDLKRYITELAELVKDSYDKKVKLINLIINCKIETLPISKALPIGLIIVELVSNSMKHAFEKQANGLINIEVFKDEKQNKNCIQYIDNGIGYDFIKVETKGLGVEIMKGLIDQLNGIVKTNNKKGFEIIIYF